jgi:peptidyl-prolyl cis-trans isomerase B (cyclophilin B)
MPPRLRLAALAAACMIVLAAALTACGAPPVAPTATDGSSQLATELASAATTPPLHVSPVRLAGNERAVIDTDKGVMEIAFYANRAPNTVAAFIELANSGYFDGTKFHRVIQGELIQGGDPFSRSDDARTGTGGPGWRLAAEFNSVPHEAGTVAMARTDEGPDTAGSQFYIALRPLPGLDGEYTVFGQLVKGLDVANRITAGTVVRSVKIVAGPGS